MLPWILLGLAVVFIFFKLGYLYGSVSQYDECTQILFEANRALADAKEYQASAKAIVRAFNEAHLQAHIEPN